MAAAILRNHFFMLANEIESGINNWVYASYKIDWLLHRIKELQAVSEAEFPEDLYSLIAELQHLVKCEIEKCPLPTTSTMSPEVFSSGCPGRPAYIISKSCLETYLEYGITVPDIASILRVSVKTIRRRMDEFDLRVADFYTSLTEEQIDAEVLRILLKHPNTGYRMMQGFLRGEGIRITGLSACGVMFSSACWKPFTTCSTRWKPGVCGTLKMKCTCLHFTGYFFPQLQNHLESFRRGWNHHRIRSAGNRSPLQMWIRGKSSGISSDPRQVDGEYGVDWSSEGQFEDNNRGVLIPEINLRRPLSEEELSTLSRPTCETLESGLDLNVNTVNHLNNILWFNFQLIL